MKHLLYSLMLCILPTICFSGILLDIAVKNNTSQELWFKNTIDGFPISILPKTTDLDTFLREDEDKQHFVTYINNQSIHIALFRQNENTIKLILCHDKEGPRSTYFLTGNGHIACSLTLNNKAKWKLYLTQEQKKNCSIYRSKSKEKISK